PGEDCKVGGECVGRHRNRAGDVARRHACRTLTDEQAEDAEAALLGESGQGFDGLRYFHSSRIIEVYALRQSPASPLGGRALLHLAIPGAGSKTPPGEVNPTRSRT